MNKKKNKKINKEKKIEPTTTVSKWSNQIQRTEKKMAKFSFAFLFVFRENLQRKLKEKNGEEESIDRFREWNFVIWRLKFDLSVRGFSRIQCCRKSPTSLSPVPSLSYPSPPIFDLSVPTSTSFFRMKESGYPSRRGRRSSAGRATPENLPSSSPSAGASSLGRGGRVRPEPCKRRGRGRWWRCKDNSSTRPRTPRLCRRQPPRTGRCRRRIGSVAAVAVGLTIAAGS